jgi:serine/threonine-protein kinase
MHDVAVGGTLHGHKLIEKVGRGHYGEVWRAEYMDHEVALKIFTGDRKPAHLRREVFAQYALGRLDGQEGRWFPRVEHLDLDADPPYLRMEFIEGSPLEELVSNAALSLDERLAIGEQVLRALAAVHAHDFVHGDLSPLNVLVTPSATCA